MISDIRQRLQRPIAWRVMVVAILIGGGCQSRPYRFLPGRERTTRRPVIAVSSFENRSGFAGEWQLGHGMADLLVTELAATGYFTVVERQHLDSVVGELRRQAGQWFRPEGRAESGHLKNAEYLIRGVINDFTHVRGGALRLAFSRLLFRGKGHTARVAMTLTLVEVASGQIMHSVYCAGYAGAAEAAIGGAYQGVVFGGDGFYRTPLGRATQDALRAGIREIIAAMPDDPWQPMIADVKDDRIVINGGRDRGVRRGMRFKVREAPRPIRDPASGDILDYVPGEIVGWIQVIEVRERVALAAPIEDGDYARGQALLRER